MQSRVRHIRAVRRADVLTVGQGEGDLARTPALGVGGMRIDTGSQRPQQAPEVGCARAVGQQGDPVCAMLLRNRRACARR